jgi:hypothetical protein
MGNMKKNKHKSDGNSGWKFSLVCAGKEVGDRAGGDFVGILRLESNDLEM